MPYCHSLTFCGEVLICSSLDSGEHIVLTSDLMGISHLNHSTATSKEMYFCRVVLDKGQRRVCTADVRNWYMIGTPKVEAAGNVR